MDRIKNLAFLLSLAMLLGSCETDFNVNSEWKAIIAVYGILDQTDSVHFIRINKAFLAENNAAVIEDSLGGAEFEVKLIENLNGTSREIIFDTVSSTDKQAVQFGFPPQLMYKSTECLNQDGIYTLNVLNKVTGNIVSATTSLIHDFVIEKPDPNSTSFDFQKRIHTVQKFKWLSAINGSRYQLIVRFFFKESSSPGDTVLRSVEWYQDQELSQNTSQTNEIESRYYNEKFFTTCSSYIPYTDPATEAAVSARQVNRIDFIYIVIGNEMNTYLDFNAPLVGVIPDKPEYTNVNNGLGLFSCRFSKSISMKIGQLTELDLIDMPVLKFVKNPDNY